LFSLFLATFHTTQKNINKNNGKNLIKRGEKKGEKKRGKKKGGKKYLKVFLLGFFFVLVGSGSSWRREYTNANHTQAQNTPPITTNNKSAHFVVNSVHKHWQCANLFTVSEHEGKR
jgi:hypothetical protein